MQCPNWTEVGVLENVPAILFEILQRPENIIQGPVSVWGGSWQIIIVLCIVWPEQSAESSSSNVVL